MISERDKEETAAAKDMPQLLRERIGNHLEKRVEFLEHASTERHVELLQNDVEDFTIIRSVSDQHQAIVLRIAQEIKTPSSSIDDYRHFGRLFATTAVERGISLRDAINGLLFLKSEILRELADEGFLLEMDSMEVKGLVDFIGTRIDVLFVELAVSFHRNFTERLEEQLEFREKQNRQKDLFIRIATHEIRNPLANALSLCELAVLSDGADEKSWVASKEKFAEIRSNLFSINRHLTQLVDMSLLEDNKLSLKTEEVNLPDLLQRITRSYERMYTDRKIICMGVTALRIQTDPDRVDQIISNLLQNATRYSPQGSSIELSWKQENSNVLISVTDQGDGIKEEDQERIFDPYLRLVKDENKVEGLGLGLYISRILAHALGGTLTVESVVGKGSTFTLTLPLRT